MRLILAILMLFSVSGLSQQFDPLPGELDAAYQYLFNLQQQRHFDGLISDSARFDYWNEYWKSIDPTPETEENELLVLFRRRYSDLLLFQQLVQFTEGWRGDRGHVYLIYGAPNEIHKTYPNVVLLGETQKEVWVYEVLIDGIENKVEIQFEDQEGIMKLKTPVIFAKNLTLLPRLPQVNFQLELK